MLIVNAVEMLDTKGGWKAPDTTLWREDLHAATASGRTCSARVAVELGYGIVADDGPSGKLGHWAVAGIPDAAMKLHSKRSDDIAGELVDVGFDSYRAKGHAARNSRKAKRHQPVDDLMAKWTAELAAIGITVEDMDRTVTEESGQRIARDLTPEIVQALVEDLLSSDGRLAERKVFSRRDVIAAAAPHLFGHTADTLDDVVDRVLADPAAIPLLGVPGAKERVYAPACVIATEHAIAAVVEAGRARTDAPQVSADLASQAMLDKQRSMGGVLLTTGQQQAVSGITGSGRGVDIVVGVAGAGKTTALDAVRLAFEEAGYTVVGTATSGQAARTLGRDANLDQSSTLASLLWRLDHHQTRLTASTVVILDSCRCRHKSTNARWSGRANCFAFSNTPSELAPRWCSSATPASFRRSKPAERSRVSSDALTPVNEDWLPLVEESIRAKSDLDAMRAKHPERVERALQEQVDALKRIVARKLTTFVGRAGTGKTTVLGALSRSSTIGGPVLFLAPTGKARVRMSRNVAAGSSVQTVAQYLLSRGAYDTATQQPLILDEGTYDGHRTVVIDESSMLTEETLLAVLNTFSPNVNRLILVGDTAQLPPIGAGRPFTDLVAHLAGDIVFDDEEDTAEKVSHRQGAHARLTVEVRNHQGDDSDTLRCAKFFSGDPLPANGEAVIGDLIAGKTLNDLDVRYWETEKDLHAVLSLVLNEKLGLEPGDTATFNELLGISHDGKYWKVTDPDSPERWQILSPVRGDLWGVAELNRWGQRTWRGGELEACRTNKRWTNPFGSNEIIRLDKVLLSRNIRSKKRFNYDTREPVEEYLANGDIGLCANDRRAKGTPGRGSVMDIMFAGRSGAQFGFLRRDFGGETGNGMFDLAYALTIHKSQGSDLDTVIVVLPRQRESTRASCSIRRSRARESDSCSSWRGTTSRQSLILRGHGLGHHPAKQQHLPDARPWWRRPSLGAAPHPPCRRWHAGAVEVRVEDHGRLPRRWPAAALRAALGVGHR